MIKKIITIIIIFASCFGIKVALAEYYYDSSQVNKLNSQVKQINKTIYSRQNQIKKEKLAQQKYLIELRKKQSEKATLANQVAILDNRIKKFELDVENVEIDISLTELEINKTNADIKMKNAEIAKSEQNLSNVLNSLNKEDQDDIVEIFLLNNNLSDFLSQIQYLEDINSGIEKSLKDLSLYKKGLEEEKYNLDAQNEKLETLKNSLEDKLKIIEIERESKKIILEETEESEEKYERLVKLAEQEQLKASQDISRLEAEVRSKLEKIEKSKIRFNDNGFIWPVPKNVITADFHDKSYPYRHIFEHPAVDIRAAHRTTLRAAASGYVARTREAGMGYNYIMIIHGDGLATVYGHVNKINVKEDQYVTQGQVIGLTGGMPGTLGAGRLTTGPHLHFEVRLNGVPVDPLSYLP